MPRIRWEWGVSLIGAGDRVAGSGSEGKVIVLGHAD